MRITAHVKMGQDESDGSWWVEVTTTPSKPGDEPLMVGPFATEEACQQAFKDTKKVAGEIAAKHAAN